MKKTVSVIIIALLILSACQAVLARESGLIENVQISLKTAETPKRLEVSFDLTESLNLARGGSNIIFEFFTDDGGGLEAVNYKKDKSWSGYLNSYDNYPSGERKYSSGASGSAYPDEIPAARLYTSTRTGASIDVALVAAVKITVLRQDNSGETATVYADGTVYTERIEVPVADEAKNTGIRFESTTAALPSDAVLMTSELSGGPVYELVSAALEGAEKFIAFEITLEANGDEIQPNGYITLSIPVPGDFGDGIAVHRINDDGTTTPYSITLESRDGVRYATFETDHFSVYVLSESPGEKDDTPKTGTPRTGVYWLAAAAISLCAYFCAGKIGKKKRLRRG